MVGMLVNSFVKCVCGVNGDFLKMSGELRPFLDCRESVSGVLEECSRYYSTTKSTLLLCSN